LERCRRREEKEHQREERAREKERKALEHAKHMHQRALYTVLVELRRRLHPLYGYFVLVVGVQCSVDEGVIRTKLYEEHHEIPDDIQTVEDFKARREWFEPGSWEDVTDVRVYLCRDVGDT
jgi:hypothetical protein